MERTVAVEWSQESDLQVSMVCGFVYDWRLTEDKLEDMGSALATVSESWYYVVNWAWYFYQS